MTKEFTLFERPNKDVLSTLHQHEGIRKEEKKSLIGYSLLGDKIKVTYRKKNNGYGRYYPRLPYSCTYMWRRIRSSLFSQTELDIDIVNCHPNIARYLLKKKKLGQFESLDVFCENRDELISECDINEEAIERYNRKNSDCKTKKCLIKILTSSVLNGQVYNDHFDRSKSWESEFGLDSSDYFLSQGIKNYLKDCLEIRKTLIKAPCFEKIVTWLEDNNSKKQSVSARSKVAIILAEYESRIIKDAIDFAQVKDFIVTAYMYDGFQILKKKNVDDLIFNLNQKYEFIEFKVKQFETPLGSEFCNDEYYSYDLDNTYCYDDNNNIIYFNEHDDDNDDDNSSLFMDDDDDDDEVPFDSSYNPSDSSSHALVQNNVISVDGDVIIDNYKDYHKIFIVLGRKKADDYVETECGRLKTISIMVSLYNNGDLSYDDALKLTKDIFYPCDDYDETKTIDMFKRQIEKDTKYTIGSALYDLRNSSKPEIFESLTENLKKNRKKYEFDHDSQLYFHDALLRMFKKVYANYGELQEAVRLLQKYLIFCVSPKVNFFIKNKDFMYEPYDETEKFKYYVETKTGFKVQKTSFKTIMMDSIDYFHIFHKIVFEPKNPSEKILTYNNNFNIFEGWNAKLNYDIEQDKKDEYISLFDTLVDNLSGNVVDHKDWLLNVFSSYIQKPNKKVEVIPIITGLQGTGKGTLARILKKLYKRKHFLKTADLQSICGDFNGIIEGKLIIILDDLKSFSEGQTKEVFNKLKSLSTDEEQTINKKFVNQYDDLQTKCNLIILTNHSEPIPLEDKQRRGNILPSVKLDMEEQEYFFKNLNEKIEDPVFKDVILTYLYERKITSNIRVIPKTDETISCERKNMNKVQRFILAFVDANYRNIWETPLEQTCYQNSITSTYPDLGETVGIKELIKVYRCWENDTNEKKRLFSDSKIEDQLKNYCKKTKEGLIITKTLQVEPYDFNQEEIKTILEETNFEKKMYTLEEIRTIINTQTTKEFTSNIIGRVLKQCGFTIRVKRMSPGSDRRTNMYIIPNVN